MFFVVGFLFFWGEFVPFAGTPGPFEIFISDVNFLCGVPPPSDSHHRYPDFRFRPNIYSVQIAAVAKTLFEAPPLLRAENAVPREP